ncbi:MAG: hypothetical protein IJQ55_04910 [Alphaproteobacteria bacterium]|nr:hypothetical protein [Alphaproteobacteria bacterium]
MKKYTKFNLLLLFCALLCGTNSANAVSIYDNNMSVIDINMLTNTFMAYTNHGENLADYFRDFAVYGTMRRLDEYGDDGSTLKNQDASSNKLIKNVWANANHINENVHYNKNFTKRARLNLPTVGTTTKDIELKYGRISAGGFASYINSKITDIKSGGYAVGIFTDYKYRNFGAKILTNVGALNNTVHNKQFNNSWVNIGNETYAKFKIDNTLYFKPALYLAYTFVASDDLSVNGDYVSSKDYNFFNIAPSIQFIKEVLPNWYGAFSAKYVAHFGGENDIYVNNVKQSCLKTDNHTDVGLDLEYNFKRFVFGGNIHKQIGGIDGWSSNLNVKYMF